MFNNPKGRLVNKAITREQVLMWMEIREQVLEVIYFLQAILTLCIVLFVWKSGQLQGIIVYAPLPVDTCLACPVLESGFSNMKTILASVHNAMTKLS